MDMDKYIALAMECGFTHAKELDPSTLEFMPEVRDMCAAGKCRSYGTNWSCPPACGELDELENKCSEYTSGVILQTVGYREHEFDFESFMDAGKKHGKTFESFYEKLRKMGADVLPMGAGGCRRCEKCTYPDEPCRFPEKLTPSMEACGLLVSKVCQDNDIPYYYGKDTIAYVACCLFK